MSQNFDFDAIPKMEKCSYALEDCGKSMQGAIEACNEVVADSGSTKLIKNMENFKEGFQNVRAVEKETCETWLNGVKIYKQMQEEFMG